MSALKREIAKGEAFDQLYDRLMSRTRPFYFVVDGDACLQMWWGDAEHFGFAGLRVGVPIDSVTDFLVGIDPGVELDLPVITTPNGAPASVQIRPTENGGMSVLLLDARTDYLRQYELQQQANEVELLSRRQMELLQELNETQIELEKKHEEAKEANLLKSHFISNVSHEFRTPLTSVLGYADLLRPHLQDKSDLAEHVHAITRGGRHLLSLVENLLDQGRLDQGEIVISPEPIDLVRLVDDLKAVFRNMAEQKGLTINFQVADSGVVVVDDTRVRQIMMNLIGNAVKFTVAGHIDVAISWSDDRLQVAVIDTGPGIPVHEQARIFAPFARAESETGPGAGLGLSISARLVELLGGKLQLESRPGEGSRFYFDILAPLSVSAPGTLADIEQAAQSVSTNTNRVLLADDDEDIARLLQHILEQHDFEVMHAQDGNAAFEMVCAHSPDCVLLDMNMPGMTGIEVTQQLRKTDFSGTIVLLTATASAIEKDKALDAGCDTYLIKPVDPSVLVDALRASANV